MKLLKRSLCYRRGGVPPTPYLASEYKGWEAVRVGGGAFWWRYTTADEYCHIGERVGHLLDGSIILFL
jgi:hypothetical protein